MPRSSKQRAAGLHAQRKSIAAFLKDGEQLEENYTSFRNVFEGGKKNREEKNGEEEDEERNPFEGEATEEELAAIETSLKTNNGAVAAASSAPVDEDHYQKQRNIIDGSVDFDEYDQSGKNPFF